MDEAQFLADRVAVIVAGRVVAEGTPSTLGGRDAARPVISYRLAADVLPPPGLGSPASPDGVLRLMPEDLTAALHALTGWALENAVTLMDLRIERPSLEDVYLGLTTAGPPGSREPAADPTAKGTRR